MIDRKQTTKCFRGNWFYSLQASQQLNNIYLKKLTKLRKLNWKLKVSNKRPQSSNIFPHINQEWWLWQHQRTLSWMTSVYLEAIYTSNNTRIKLSEINLPPIRQFNELFKCTSMQPFRKYSTWTWRHSEGVHWNRCKKRTNIFHDCLLIFRQTTLLLEVVDWNNFAAEF